MLVAPLKKFVIAALVIAALFATMANVWARAMAADDPAAAGTVISNRAEATYEDETGASYGTVSPTITITVLSVSTLVVTPDETESSAAVGAHERVTRLFRACNTGNTPDFYTITRAEVNAPATINSIFFDTDASGTLGDSDAPVQVGQSMSARTRQGSCVGVLVVVDTNDSAPQTALTIRLTARSNVVAAANGTGEDDGTIINVVGQGSQLSAPDNASLPPMKTVNGAGQAVVATGTPFTYNIAFRNHGDVVARAVIVSDELPAGVEYVAGSLRLDERVLTDAEDTDEGRFNQGRVQVLLPQVDPGQLVQISFRATITSGATAGVGLVNSAAISGQNVKPVSSTNAVVLVDPFGTVFSGRSNGATAILGARVEILLDQNGASLLAIPAEQGFLPNTHNDNPYATDAAGHYSFAFTPEQLGTDAAPIHYFMRVTADGYVTRMLELTARPTRADLFGLTVHALDNQPLAHAGRFDLVNEDVQIEDLAAVALNVPMFERRSLEITKSADRQRAEIGDTITYRVEVHNSTSGAIHDVTVRDRLPESFHYATGTARLGSGSPGTGQAIEPLMQNDEMVFRIPEIGAGATAQILYRVRVGANAREGSQENLAVAMGAFSNGEQIQTAPARAVVQIGSGVFSTRQMILGRVFEDMNGNGMFDDGDHPMADVRLFLQNGQSVVTDSEGLYNFPSLGDGPQVIALDPVSVPAGYALADGGSIAGRSWTRLLRTPVGGGALLRQNFALTRNESSQHAASQEPTAANATPTPASDSLPAISSIKGTGDNSGVGQPSADATTLSAASDATSKTTHTAGTYEVASTEMIEPVGAGEVRVISPTANSILMSPAMQIEARVMLNWTIRVEVNGERISDKNIGQSRLDPGNNVSTFTFVGINLRPGPNRVTITATSPEGAAGRTEEINVMGRGPARRLEISAERTEIQADGRDASILHVRALDQWGSPAIDGQVALSASAGRLVAIEDKAVAPNPLEERDRTPAAAEMKQGQSELLVMLKDGEAALKLVASGAPGAARLRAQMGELDARGEVRITPESRPAILVGLAEVTIGKALPEVSLRGEEGSVRSRLSFFYHGNLWKRSILTLSYDSQRPINRTAGRDRLFQLDPLDRAYPLFGDSSTRYESAESNSKLYARIDRGRSYAMFGDFTADMDELSLAGYVRKLTGVKVHVENSRGDFVTVTGARPDTAFARDVFPAGTLGLLRLSHGDILPGSETVVLEVRDRRNPEIILSSERLIRSVDYNLNPATGEVFFLRYISTFDYALNLVQLVVTYEHRSDDLSTAVYTARAVKNFESLGLALGFSAVVQQSDLGSFALGGVDGVKSLPHSGELRFAYARSQGEIMGGGNIFDATGTTAHTGDAYRVEVVQPLSFYEAVVRARYANASAGFFNPFGATITPGSRRGELSLEFKPRSKSTLRFGLMSERNRTDVVDNTRLTLSAAWDQVVTERVRFHLGYDHRSFNDDLTDSRTDSNLITAAAEVQLTDKLNVSIKREQNLGDSDPTYPNQTTLAATYQVSQWTRLFYTQRLASAPIIPIGDVAQTGFAFTEARHETAVGIETRFGKYTSMIGRYQLENGINGDDSYAVIGLQNRLPISQELAIELGFERGFHLAGEGQSFNSATIGLGWTPNEEFRASARYEFRDRGSVGQLFAVGAAGRLSPGLTVMSRLQWSKADFSGRNSSSIEGMAALAFRPLESDRVGLLFSYNHRSLVQEGADGLDATRDRIDSLATDGYIQVTPELELYGRFALRFNANGQPGLPFVSTLTYLTQERIQYRLMRRLDWAGEARLILQPSSGTRRSVYGTELGFWALPDLRLGLGYNFTGSREPVGGRSALPVRSGFYFTISSKLSNLFDLFGASRQSLVTTGSAPPPTPQSSPDK